MSSYAKDIRVTAGPYGGFLVDRDGDDFHVWHTEDLQWTAYTPHDTPHASGFVTADAAIFALIGEPQ